MTKTWKKRVIISALLCLVLCFGMFTPFLIPANAADKTVDITTSTVREDLSSMGMDNLSYLSNDENIFISMAQRYDDSGSLRTYVYFNYIGSLDSELFISISTAEMDENYEIKDDPKEYSLSLVNHDSTWVKYEILGLPNLDKVTRRYKLNNISSSDVILNINETFIYHGITNDSIEVFHQEIETITITEKEVSFFCYGEEHGYYDFWGLDEMLGWGKKYTDAWYIFFNTDKKIDTLKEVEITYQPYTYHTQVLASAKMSTAFTEDYLLKRIEDVDFDEETSITYGEQIVVTITPGTSRVTATGNWWSSYETVYQNIDNIMDLREYNHNDEEGNPFVFTNEAEKFTWGVNFLLTEKSTKYKGISLAGTPADSTIIDGAGVRNTAIVRLKYEINGIVKNAYAIDVPTDDFSGNSAEEKIEGWFEKILKLISLLVIVLIISAVIKPLSSLLKFIGELIKTLLNVLIAIIFAPFKLFGWLFKAK